jgi:hypothetical protein
VIHLGDYHYREYCDQPALCSPLRDNGVVVGYDWAGWHADFFAPATPLLAAAAWVTVRGNHEGCDRGGEGWMRFLSPLPYQACPDQRFKTDSRSVLANNLTADAYRIDLGDKLTLVVADNAGHEDYRPATPQEVEIFTRTLRALTTLPALPQAPPVWLLLHRPIWYDGLDAGSPPNALQTALAGKLPANVQFVFAGHQHAFQTINFAPAADLAHYPAGRPAQVVIGASGTQLEALDPQSPVYEGKVGSGGMERAQPDGKLYDGVTASSGIFLNRYSFLLLELDDSGWGGTLLDADGKTISHCRLNGERKEIACSFPVLDSPVQEARSCPGCVIPAQGLAGKAGARPLRHGTRQPLHFAAPGDGRAAAHARIADPVRRMHDGRREAARELVFATRTGFEAPQSLAQAIGDSLVETEFEMQAVVVAGTSPVTPVERFVTAKTQRDGDRHAGIAGNEGDHPFSQSRRQIGEAGRRESGVIVEFLEGAGVERVQQWPFGGLDLIAVAGLDRQATLRHAPPFRPHLAALGGTESRQITVEIAAAGVDPVKLDIMADQ